MSSQSLEFGGCLWKANFEIQVGSQNGIWQLQGKFYKQNEKNGHLKRLITSRAKQNHNKSRKMGKKHKSFTLKQQSS